MSSTYMMSTRFPAAAVLSAVLLLATQSPAALAAPAPPPRTLVIGVDHVDADNQQPDKFRVFEYTDFFSRSVRIRSGDTLDFRTAPNAFHIIGLAKNEYSGRVAYPVALNDSDDPLAVGSGGPSIMLGPSFSSVTGGTTKGGGTLGDPNAFPPGPCGFVQFGQAPCTFSGGQDVEAQGQTPGLPPSGTDWQITINAEPGTFSYFCYIHPGMSGEVHVVKNANDPVSSQADIDTRSQTQFLAERAAGLAAEAAANKVVIRRGGAPGNRIYEVSVGVSAADDHVAINEMLPQNLNLVKGDQVWYKWRDDHNVHSVTFPTDSPNEPPPFFPDFEAGEAPEFAVDPGNAPKGTLLTNPNALVDSGVLFGKRFYLPDSMQFWGISTDSTTPTATFTYQCIVHDFMHGTLKISP